MTVRRAETRDIDRIAEILYQVADVHHKLRPDLFRGGARKYKDGEISSIIVNDMRPVFVAEIDDVVCGYIFCEIEDVSGDNVRCDCKTLYIDDLCVDEQSREGGIGKALFDYAVGYARDIGCYNVTLNVWTGNDDAERFYRHRGMKPLKTCMELIL